MNLLFYIFGYRNKNEAINVLFLFFMTKVFTAILRSNHDFFAEFSTVNLVPPPLSCTDITSPCQHKLQQLCLNCLMLCIAFWIPITLFRLQTLHACSRILKMNSCSSMSRWSSLVRMVTFKLKSQVKLQNIYCIALRFIFILSFEVSMLISRC